MAPEPQPRYRHRTVNNRAAAHKELIINVRVEPRARLSTPLSTL
jgi:hypothetical protein